MPGNDTCPSCGTVVSASDRVCPSCGAVRSDDATVLSHGSLERITAERLASATSGEFEILERLGYGAMGSVYLARDVALSRRVAIKVISPHLLEDESVISRFRLEAQTVAALRHPNIVNLYGVRELGDLHYFIMDFIDGPSLRSLMKVHAPLEIPVAQALLFQIGGALSYAHRRGRGVIHRDIKPANIMVDREGHAVVMDFGISRVGEGRSGFTQTGATNGTPEYMSPEQCMDQELTGASDQYALGIVAYEMLTGEVPFSGSTYAMMMSHASSPPPPIRDTRPDCPTEVEAAVMRMLAKAPAERFSDMDAAVKALKGKPLSPGDPILDRIIELAESASSGLVALDESSPLSPVPGSTERVTIAIVGLPDIVEPGDRFDLHVESREGTLPTREASDVVWSTSDPAVASVEDGTVFAQVPGSVSLTATVGAVASTVILSVRERRSATVSVRPQTVLIERGGTMPLKAEVLDRKGDPVTTSLVWSTEDASVASVAQDGTLTAVAPGSTRVVVDADGTTASVEIEVQQAAVHELSIGEMPHAIQVGDELSLEVIVTDSQGTVLERPVAWHSDQPKVVAIREGRPVAVAPGTVTLSAECEGRSATVQVKVDLADVASVTIVGLPETSRPGDGFPLQAVLLDRDGKPLIRAVRWSSGDPSVASVSDSGLVRVHAEGRVTLTASSGEVSESLTVESSRALPESAAASAQAGTAAEVPHQAKRRWAPWVGLAAIIVVALGLAQLLGSDRAVPVEGEEDPASAQVELPPTAGGPTETQPASPEGGAPQDAAPRDAAPQGAPPQDAEAPALEPPTREEALEQVQRFVNLLRSGDAEGVGRLLGRTGGQGGRDETLARMREADFTARLGQVGQPVLTPNGAAVGFEIELMWRNPRGARNQRKVPFLAALRPTPDGWRLAGVTVRQGANRTRGGQG